MALSRRNFAQSPSSDLASVSSRRPVLILRQALDEYEDCLTDLERKEFRAVGKPGATAAMHLTALIDRSQKSNRHQCMSPRLMTLLESMQQFSSIVDTFINSHPEIAALVWGGVRLALLMVNNVTTYFEKLSELFMKLGSTCPRFDEYGTLYPDSIEVQTSLCNYYATVIRLCRYSIQISRKPAPARLLVASVFPFELEFGRYNKELNTLSDRVMEAVELASQKAQAKLVQLHEESLKWQKQQGSSLAMIKDSLLQNRRLSAEEMVIIERRVQDEKKIRILKAFSTYKYQDSWRQIRKDCTPGTSLWVLETDEFRSWRVGTLKRIWCCGRLGSGKSVISACAVNHLLGNQTSGEIVSFFFCRHDDEESLKARTIIGTIAKQLAQDLPSNVFANVEDDDVESSMIISFLSGNLSRSDQHFIIIDGLDECDQTEAMEAIESLSKLQASPLHVRIYCSSRRNMLNGLPSNFEPEKIIDMENPENYQKLAHDMNQFVEKNLKINDLGMESIILQKLHEGAEGMFLWVKLQLQTLRKAKSNNQLLEALQTLPQNLPQTYERILTQVVDKDDPDFARKIFSWVAATKRPLSLNELREAIAIKPLKEARDAGQLVYDMIEAISCCGNLIFLNEEHLTLHFTHSSVKQYLTSTEVHESVKKHRISLRDADLEIGIACVTYLNYSMGALARQRQSGSPFADVPRFVQANSSSLGNLAVKFTAPRSQHRDRSNERTYRLLREMAGDTELRRRNREFGKYVFRSYAERFWLEHTKTRIDPKSSQIFWELWCNLIDRIGWIDKCFGITWKGDEWNNRTDGVIKQVVELGHWSLAQWLVTSKPELSEDQLLILFEGAAANNHQDLINCCLATREVPQDLLDCALFEAARSGHLAMVDRLLLAHANANTGHNDGRKPLSAAASGGFLNVVQRLLEEHPDIDAMEAIDPRRTALQAAAENGHVEVINILIDNKADINAAAALNFGRTALQAAAGEGHYLVVSSLLRQQADVNAPAGTYNGRTALQAAAEKGHLFIITELLLGVLFKGYEKADVNAPACDTEGLTALQAAAKNGNASLVAYLLKEKADINARGSPLGYGRTALQAAAENGHLDVVEMLLTWKERANVNDSPQGSSGRTALQAAAGAGHLRIVDCLLNAGADCNADPCEFSGRTALQAAAEYGHIDIVNRLLEVGASVNANPCRAQGLTALQAAARSGKVELLDLLLSDKFKADINAPAGGFEGRSALQAASESGHLTVVRRLLQKGADANAGPSESYGRTALQAAAGGGHLAVLRHLLEERANVDATSSSKHGRTAIQAAAEGGHESVLNELLQAEASVNTTLLENGKTALRAAAGGGYLNVVRILLEAGATDEAEKGTIGGQTALWAALIGKHREVAKCLEDAGYSEARFY